MLKEIDCKYHIIGFYNKNLYGFIYFNFTKTISAVEKLLSSTQIKCANKPRDSYAKIRKLDNVWEYGSYIIEKKKKDVLIETPTDNSDMIIIDIDNSEQFDKVEMLNITKTILEDNVIFRKMFLHQTEITNKLLENQAKLMENNITNTMTYSANSNNSSTDNSKNKKITNINVFLNTECKDAITMKDFINDLVIEDEDLMYLKQYGYVESVARLLNKALSNYDIYKRPIHCTDTKREVMHVKDQEGWKKEDPSGQSKNLDSAFTKLSQMQNRKMMSYYKGIDIDSPNIEEMAFVMKRISEVCGSEDAGKKKIIKKIIENIRL
jgi:hypothetical protein